MQPESVISLKSGQLLTLRPKMEQTLVCKTGCLWITIEGKPWDVVLQNEGIFKIERLLLTLVRAMQDSDFTLL